MVSGEKVAARCQAGWNRSGLIIALVLLKEGYSADEAISLIRERRSPNALCNPHFVAYIKEVYDKEFAEKTLIAQIAPTCAT
jgi:protein-tyrosine phosphatase